MVADMPDISLSHGQVLQILSKGGKPPQRLQNEVRYLRSLGVPFKKKEGSTGSGNRLCYGYYEIIELAVAIEGIKRGMKKGDIAKYLLKDRKPLREYYLSAYTVLPEDAFKRDWMPTERGVTIGTNYKQKYLRFHDRFSEAPGKLEFLSQDEIKTLAESFRYMMDPVERYPDGEYRDLIPLTRMIIEIVNLAQQVREEKPGPKPKSRKKA